MQPLHIIFINLASSPFFSSLFFCAFHPYFSPFDVFVLFLSIFNIFYHLSACLFTDRLRFSFDELYPVSPFRRHKKEASRRKPLETYAVFKFSLISEKL